MQTKTRSTFRGLAVLAGLALVSACATAAERAVPQTDDPHLATAYRVLATTPLIDGHNDLPWAIRGHEAAPRDVEAYDLRGRTPGHTDIERLRQGMVGGQFWSVYVPYRAVEEGAAKVQLEQIDIARRIIDRYPDVFELALTADDAVRIFRSGRIASMLGMEGGHAIENSLGALRSFYDLGARYMTLTHSNNIDWADSCCEPAEHGGLTAFGAEVVREMNRLGMLIDLSHVSFETMHEVLGLTRAPVIFSHSSAYGVTPHPRNVPDEVLRRLPENGGVVMVTFVNSFVNTDLYRWTQQPGDQRSATPPQATLSDVADHIEHVRRVAGIDHVGIGSDYDGATMPEGLEDVSTFPALLAELSRRGWSEADLRQLVGENVLRAWRRAEAVAAAMQAERPASTATIVQLDGVVPEGTGAYVTRLGRDTLAVETFRTTPTTFEATVVLRVPETSLTVYRGTLGRDGRLETLDAARYEPTGAQLDAPPIARTTYRFGPTSVAVAQIRGGERQAFDVEATTGAVPFIDMVHWPYELGLMRMTADGRLGELPMITGRRTQPFVITRRDDGVVVIRHPFRGTMDVDVDEAGRILRLDAANTTRAVVVDRVASVDALGLARRWATDGRSIGELSGRAEAEGVIGGANIVVDYGVPRKRGREIFGGLVSFGEVWRTGANRATHLSTDRDLVIGDARVPAGTYTLFSIPGPDEWTLMINRRTDIGGTSYDAAADLARVTMQTRRLDTTVEDFAIVVDPAGMLRIRWDRTEAYVPVRVAR